MKYFIAEIWIQTMELRRQEYNMEKIWACNNFGNETWFDKHFMSRIALFRNFMSKTGMN